MWMWMWIIKIVFNQKNQVLRCVTVVFWHMHVVGRWSYFPPLNSCLVYDFVVERRQVASVGEVKESIDYSQHGKAIQLLMIFPNPHTLHSLCSLLVYHTRASRSYPSWATSPSVCCFFRSSLWTGLGLLKSPDDNFVRKQNQTRRG